MTIAQELLESYSDFIDLLNVCDLKAIDKNQDWNVGSTEFIFEDQSSITIKEMDILEVQ